MGSLLYEVVPRSLAAAIRPVIFLLHLNTLTGPKPVARGAALTADAAVVLIVRSTMSVSIRDRTRRGDAKGDPNAFQHRRRNTGEEGVALIGLTSSARRPGRRNIRPARASRRDCT